MKRKFWKPRELVQEINRYGYRFSLKNFWIWMGIAVLGIGIISFLYELKIWAVMVVGITTLWMLPKVLFATYHHLYEQKRFMDVNNYMEQMMYSFQKNPNILFCFEDTYLVFSEGEMRDKIEAAIRTIRLEQDTKIYERAIQEIEAGYHCSRLKNMHNFMSKVERYGGEYKNTLEILLEDRRLWVERTYELQQEKQRLKKQIIISIVFAIVVCSAITFIVPKGFHIKGMFAGQLVTTILICASIWMASYAQIALSGTWFMEMKEMEEKQLLAFYMRAIEEPKINKRKMIVKSSLCLGMTFVGYFTVKKIWILGMGVVLTIYQWFWPQIQKKQARKKILREIQKSFPGWMMELALLLQANNVYVSIESTKELAPIVLKEEVEKLLISLEERPNSIDPYLQFLGEFDLPDIKSAMRMLYAMDETGAGDSSKQIENLVKRNYALMDKAERIQNEDSMASVGILIFLPMLFGTIKMLVDMVLLIIALTGSTQIMV